jgi:hypothetical protein
MSDKHYVHPHDENDLEKVLKQTGTWFERYGTTAIYGVAALLALTAVIVYVSKTPPATAPASAAFMSAEGPEQFRDIADQFPNTALGVKARLRQADLLRNSAIENASSSRRASMPRFACEHWSGSLTLPNTPVTAATRRRLPL